MIAVILPTRGLVFTEVEQSIASNLKEYNYTVFRSFTLPIPDSENFLVDQALQDPTVQYLLFVEEDTVMPEHGFVNLVKANAPIACIDYGVEGWSCTARDKTTNEILWCGLGCTLVRREVFEAMEKPYFRTDKSLLLNDWPEEKWIDVPERKRYGGQDIWFCMEARKRGFTITQVEGECKHLRVVRLGLKEINHGLHDIEQKKVIEKKQLI